MKSNLKNYKIKKEKRCNCAEKGKIWGFIVLHDKECKAKQ